ncbi:MAG: metallophosphoesterase [Myxococcota bacterium]
MLLLAAPAGASPRPQGRWAVEIVKGPYLQDVRRDSAVVMWETDVAVDGEVEVSRSGEAKQSFAAPAARLHEVRVAGLAPSMPYRYRVRSGGAWTAEAQLRTARRADEPFAFIVYGDCRSGHEAHGAIADLIAAEPADFLLHTGDLVTDGADETSWQRFFEIERDLLRERPLFPTLGNHDIASIGGADRYRAYFVLPDGSPDPEEYYAFTWGSARFIVLDSNIMFYAISRQTAWLESELAAAAADPSVRHIFVAMHHPPFSTGPHGGNLGGRLAWAPLFARYGVDMVFAGHDHDYERLAQDGVRYVVTGGAGAPPYPQDDEPAAEDALASLHFESSHHYVKVQVSGDLVEMTAVRIDGSTIESVRFRASERHGASPRVAATIGAAPIAAAPIAAAPFPRMPAWALSGLVVLIVATAGALAARGRRNQESTSGFSARREGTGGLEAPPAAKPPAGGRAPGAD